MTLDEAVVKLDSAFVGQHNNFPERLEGVLKERGIAQSKLAADIGVTPQAVSYWKKGREPDFSTLKRAAQYLGVTTDYLLGVDGSEASINPTYVPSAVAWAVVKKELTRYMALGTVEELEEALYSATL